MTVAMNIIDDTITGTDLIDLFLEIKTTPAINEEGIEDMIMLWRTLGDKYSWHTFLKRLNALSNILNIKEDNTINYQVTDNEHNETFNTEINAMYKIRNK